MVDKKIGILGGGQLGKMLCQAGNQHGIELHILEKDDSFPATQVGRKITYGDFKNYDDVYAFGKNMDIITVEIEAVNTEALHQLEKEGKSIFPQPHLLDLIRDKGEQKTFYAEHKLPTSPFMLFDDADAVRNAVEDGVISLPFVQKSRKDGYDGQGVKVVRTIADLAALIDAPCLTEDLVDIEKEIAVIVARNSDGQITSFPVVEMEFHPTANLVEFLFAPSELSQEIQKAAVTLSERLVEQLEIVGLLAVELFLTKSGEIMINEVAPRPHNSGHHTIEANITSQYEQHLRAILNLPLGATDTLIPAVMVNLLGAEGYKGKAHYQDIAKIMDIEGAHVHIYGKEMTKPFRKMGHCTVVDKNLDQAKAKARTIKQTLKIITND